MQFSDFKKTFNTSVENLCEEILADDKNSISVKNKRIGVKKLKTIIETAITLSNQKGFHAMSLRQLCNHCGLSMGGLYGYISSKEELLEVIQAQGKRTLLEVMNGSVDPKADPFTQLSGAIYAHLYLSEMMPSWFFFSYMESRFFNQKEQEKAMATELQIEKILSDILETGCAKGAFNLAHPVLAASIIKALLQDWYLKRWKYKKRNISVEDYAGQVISFVAGFVGDVPESNRA